MDSLDDLHRTYALTYELGHGHSDLCAQSPSVMQSGGAFPPVQQRTINMPQYYDRIELEELYGLPRH